MCQTERRHRLLNGYFAKLQPAVLRAPLVEALRTDLAGVGLTAAEFAAAAPPAAP